MPTPKVEALINAVWTDITSYVMYEGKVILRRGAEDWSTRARPATASFTARNTDLRFSGDVPSSAYFRQFVKGTRIRVTVTDDAEPARFYGKVITLTPTSDTSGNDLRVAVVAAGILHQIQTGKKPFKSAIYRKMERASDAVVGWWSFEAGDGRVTASVPSSLTAGAPMVAEPASAGTHRLSGVVGAGVTGPVGASSAIDLSGGGQLRVSNLPIKVGDTWRIQMGFYWSSPEEEFDSGQIIRVVTQDGSLWGVFGGFFPTLAIEAVADAGFGSSFTNVVDDGSWHHLELYVQSASAGAESQWTLLIDGELVDSDTWVIPFAMPREIVVSPTGDLSAASHLVLDEGILSDLSDSYYEAFTGHAGETPVDRMARLFAEEDITFTVVGGDSASLLMGPQLPVRFFELIEECLTADRGVMYEARDDLAVVYRTKLDIYNQLPALELDYDDRPLVDVFTPVDDEFGLTNDVAATRDGGEERRYIIPDGDFHHYSTEEPPAGIGTYDTAIQPNVSTDDEARHQASWQAHLGAFREPRYPAVTVHLSRGVFTADADLTAAAVAVTPGDRVRVANKPAWQKPGPTDLLVLGEQEVIDQFERVLSWNTAPYLPWEVWELDTGGSSLVVAASSVATSLKVDTSLGPGWSTTDEPYLWNIAGEIMRVTALSYDTPAFIAVGTIANGNNASVTPALPAGITADVGQTLWILASIRNSGTGTVDLPTGWTSIVNFGNVRLMARYYVNGVTAPLVTFTGGAANADTQARMFAFSGLSLQMGSGTKTTPAAATQLNSSAQDMAYPALDVWRFGVKFWGGWKQDDWTSVATLGVADAEVIDNATTTGDDSGIVLDYDIFSSVPAHVVAGSFVVTGGASAISRTFVVAMRSLQTATVTRSLNGVVGALAAGEAVHAIRQGALPL